MLCALSVGFFPILAEHQRSDVGPSLTGLRLALIVSSSQYLGVFKQFTIVKQLELTLIGNANLVAFSLMVANCGKRSDVPGVSSETPGR